MDALESLLNNGAICAECAETARRLDLLCRDGLAWSPEACANIYLVTPWGEQVWRAATRRLRRLAMKRATPPFRRQTPSRVLRVHNAPRTDAERREPEAAGNVLRFATTRKTDNNASTDA
jgi:hypothetical protein